MTLTRELDAAARLFADATTERTADTPTTHVIVTVTLVENGLAAGGTARVTVSWRGHDQIVGGYLASYTPVATDRVLCAYTSDNQLIITGRIVGQP